MANVADILTDNLDIWTSAIERRSTAGRGRSKKFSLYGIEKLRALILDLAVRGKLVPQDPNEEPASVLLESIAKDRKTRLKPRTADFRAAPKILNRTLPNGWCIARLDCLANSQAGFAFKSNDFNEIGAGLPLIRIRDVGLQFSGTYYSGEYREEFVVTEGDYLISMDGEFRVAVWTNGPALLNQRVSRLQFYSDKIAKQYVVIDLQKQLSKLQGVKAYTTVDHLSGKQISEAEIALPPLAEQHRIVAKVDELMALCDRLEAQTYDAIEAHELLVGNLLATLPRSQNAEELAENWARIETHFDTLLTTEASVDQLKQTILQLAVMGKLVPQDPNDEPASELLSRIAAAKSRMISIGKLKSTKSPPPIRANERPFQLPVAWQWCRLSEAIDVRDGTHDSPKDATGNETFPLVTSKDFKNGKIDFENARRISAEDHFIISKRSLVERDDILFSMIGGNLGNQVQVKTDEQFSVKNVALFKYYDRNMTLPEFIKIFLENIAFDLQIKASGGAQPFVSLGYLRAVIFALPPVEEQRRIVAKVKELFRHLDLIREAFNCTRVAQVSFADAIASKAVS
ncbi:restriction endonuclease subunit S [Phreatobacter aquaticus]|uniref:Restriction endonuclease subunit S n=1 Tax=Phreatobacter aquaticus TaxID=2570229 RepID=A0A4D7QHB3_9HYPH|nr:restriction endonuclease subunit S [Phreatobacter aquaticus]QCK85229.1 restriction endonuclease subunit S [Phreatobacter aquaticus]